MNHVLPLLNIFTKTYLAAVRAQDNELRLDNLIAVTWISARSITSKMPDTSDGDRLAAMREQRAAPFLPIMQLILTRMGTGASPRLLDILHPKTKCWFVPAAETPQGRGRAEASEDLPPHAQGTECGRWPSLLGRILPFLAGQQCFTHPNSSIHKTKKHSGSKVMFAVPTCASDQFSMCPPTLLMPVAGNVKNA